jgi:hypothetical protein
MRDSPSVDDASFYFRDPAYERPPFFPLVSTHAIVVDAGPKSLENLPRKISVQHHQMDDLSPMSTATDRFTFRKDDLDEPDEFWGSFIADDDSSCGTLDYSLDSQPDGEYGNDQINQALITRFDVHATDQKEAMDCFKLPLEWIALFLDNLWRSD